MVDKKELTFNNLNIKNTIELNRCNRISTRINTKINKVLIDCCNDVSITLKNLINGIEINKSSVVLNLCNGFKIPILYCYKSKIHINIFEKDLKNLKVMNEDCEISIHSF